MNTIRLVLKQLFFLTQASKVLYVPFSCRVEKERSQLLQEGDELAESVEKLQKAKVGRLLSQKKNVCLFDSESDFLTVCLAFCLSSVLCIFSTVP